MKKILKNITCNKKLLVASILLIVAAVTGSAYGLVELTKTKPQPLVISPVKVKTNTPKATVPVANTATPNTSTPTNNTQTNSSPTAKPTTSTQISTPTPNCSEIVQNLENGYENQSMTSYNQQIINEEIYVNTTDSTVYGMTGKISVADPQLAMEDVDGAVWSVNDELSVQYNDLSNQANIYGCPNATITVNPIVVADPTIQQIIADIP